MTPFFLIISLQAIVGASIVLAGLFFVGRGILNMAGGPESTFEVSKLFTVKTCSPAIGLLAVGALLLAGAAYFSKAEAEVLRVRGTLVGANPGETRTTLVTEYWKDRKPGPDGSVLGTVNLGSKALSLRVVAPGFEQPEGEIDLDASETLTGVLDMRTVDLTLYLGDRKKTLDEVLPPSTTPTIASAPALPPTESKPAWNANR
jgi:hypothetical protein